MTKNFISIILCFALLLALTFALDGTARKNKQAEHVWLMQTLLPSEGGFEPIEYTGEDELIRSVHRSEEGYIIETAIQGYAGEIVMLIGVDNDGNVRGLVVLEAHETLGLGSTILTNHGFLSQFLNKSGSFSVGGKGDNSADGGSSDIYVDGISGATVSSKAVARCVNSATAYVTGADAGSSATVWEG